MQVSKHHILPFQAWTARDCLRMPGILDDLDNDMWRFAKSWGTSYHPVGKWMTVLVSTWFGFEDPSFQEPPVCCVKNCACRAKSWRQLPLWEPAGWCRKALRQICDVVFDVNVGLIHCGNAMTLGLSKVRASQNHPSHLSILEYFSMKNPWFWGSPNDIF